MLKGKPFTLFYKALLSYPVAGKATRKCPQLYVHWSSRLLLTRNQHRLIQKQQKFSLQHNCFSTLLSQQGRQATIQLKQLLLFCLFYDEVVLKWLLARTFDRFHKCCDPKINVISWPPNSKYSSPFRHMGCLIKSLRPRIHVRFLFAHLLGQFCFNRELRFLCCSLLAMFCWVVEYITVINHLL